MKDLQELQFFSILKNIPYENVSKILRLEMEPEKRPRDSKTVLSEHREFHFGGTCFSLVNLVVRSLLVEGIQAYPVRADIHRRNFPHFFALAEFRGSHYLIDPGYLINAPLELSFDKETHQKNGAIDFIVNHISKGQFKLQTVTNGQHKTRYSFHIVPLEEAVFMDYWVRSFDYLNAIVASRFIDDTFIYINGSYVQIRSNGNIEKYDQQDKALYYLKTYFDLDDDLIGAANALLEKNRAQHVPKSGKEAE
ncbi:MAG: arylamine N-acetyltransferase [Candidatus Marinimicrobia bacterium]|nr:arylamine N-acetyltransferase [Candidatus Neomarinimicrobiota bacterium]